MAESQGRPAGLCSLSTIANISPFYYICIKQGIKMQYPYLALLILFIIAAVVFFLKDSRKAKS